MSLADGLNRRATREERRVFTRTTRRGFAICVVLATAGVFPGCDTTDRDISHLPPFSPFVGQTYRIVGDVDASKVNRYAPTNSPDFIMLHPRSRRPTGPEIAFTRPLRLGQTFRIVSARVFDTPIDDSIYYLIELSDDPLQTPLPVRIRFERDNGSLDDGSLNPSFYERVK